MAVDDVDDLADADLEHAVGGRIGDHHAGEFVARGGSLFSQFFHVDVAVVVAADEHDVEAAHRRRSGVGTVGGGGDDHHAAAGAVVGVEVAADGHQAGVFTRGAAVGLQRAAGEARDHGQVVLEFVDHLQGALGLVGGGVRVQVAEFAPAEREHLGGGVELHGAAAQRNHGVGQRNVLALEPFDVAHHLGFGMIGAEYFLREDGRGAGHRHGSTRGDGAVVGAAEDLRDGAGFLAGGKFVEGDLHGAGVGIPEVEARFEGLGADGFGIDADDADRVEEVFGGELEAGVLQPGGHGVGEARGVLRDFGDAFRAVPHGEHTGHGGHQGRGGADVGGGFLPFDVLLAGLEGQPHGAFAEAADGDADDAARQVSLVFVGAGHPAGGRTAEAHRKAEALGGAAGNVGTPGGRLFQHGQGEEVAPGGHEAAGGVGLLAEGGIVAHGAVGGGVLDQRAVAFVFKCIFIPFARVDFDAQSAGAGAQHGEHVGEDVLIHEDHVLAGLDGVAGAQLEHHAHGFGGSGRVVEHRAVGQREAGERGDHRLEVDERLEAALGDLGLVGRVGRVPAGILENVAGDHGRGSRPVETEADHRAEVAVLAGDLLEAGQIGLLADGGIEFEGFFQQNILRNGLSDEFVERGYAQDFEHLLLLFGSGTVVAVDKGKRHGLSVL